MHIGLCGEVRAVVLKADGGVKVDTGYIPNVITELGLDFIGRGSSNNSSEWMLTYCAIGTGNSQPQPSNGKLDNAIAVATYKSYSGKEDYNPEDGDIYKVSSTAFYRFTDLKNVNIAEVGLSDGSGLKSGVYTRTLITDSSGASTTITVLEGEVLELYYRLWQVHDLKDVTGVIEASIDGNKVPYNYIVRRAGVGGANIGGSWTYRSSVGSVYWLAGNNSRVTAWSGDIGSITGMPGGRGGWSLGSSYHRSDLGVYEATIDISADITTFSGDLRSLLVITGLGAYQIRFGSVDGDLPISKSDKEVLKFGLSISWGRYTGAI